MRRRLPIALPSRQLIVNADDFGVSPERDAGILDCWRAGGIGSASLLVDGDDAEAATRQATESGLPLGLHLNLSDGERPGAGSLAGRDGRLRGRDGLRVALATGEITSDDIAADIRRQFARFIALTGSLPTHVDGHHHCHVEPAVAAVLAPIMVREYGVTRVRLPREAGLEALTGDDEFDINFQRAVVRVALAAEALFAAHGIIAPQAFLGQSTMGSRLSAAGIGTALARLAGQGIHSVELMVHPGRPSLAGSDFCRSPARAHEAAVLCSAEWRSATAGWTPSSFADLRRDAGCPTLLIYGKLTPATGNAETARRYAAAWADRAEVLFRPLLADPDDAAAVAREAAALAASAEREGLDLAVGIHLDRAGTPLAAAFARTDTPLPYALLASGTDANADIDHPERRARIAQALAGADALLCLTEDLRQRLAGLPLPAETLTVANGIDVATESAFSLRAELGLAGDAALVLLPAALRRIKGVHPAIAALAPLLTTRFRDHVLVVLGPALEPDYAAAVQAELAALERTHPGLRRRVVLHPGLPRADYLAALREAALVLNASDHEGLSHVLAEAMAAGVPVLARDNAGNRQLVRHGRNGRLFADFAALPEAYAECFDAPAATKHLADAARRDIAERFPAASERDTLATLLDRLLARRQTPLSFAGTSLRLDRAADTHPVSAENLALFASLRLSPAARAGWPETLPAIADIGCGCGVFGLVLLDAIAASGRRVGRLLFSDPHRPSLAALARTLTRHRPQLNMLDTAELDDGSLLAPLRERGARVHALCANLPQTPGPAGFRLDRNGGTDGAELLCALIAGLPHVLAADGEACLLHIDLAHPARVAAAIAAAGLQAECLAEQVRQARFADYEALHPGLADHLRAEQAAGRAEFVADPDGTGFAYRARLLRLRHAVEP